MPTTEPPQVEDDADPLLDEEAEAAPGVHDEKGARGFVADFVRKAAVAGLGAVFMTEEGLRGLAGQMKLPKEVLGAILSQADKTKTDVTRIVSDEVRRFLQSDKLRDEFLKMIAGMTLEVRAEVKLVPDRVKNMGDTPSLMPKVKIHDLKTEFSSKKKPSEGE